MINKGRSQEEQEKHKGENKGKHKGKDQWRTKEARWQERTEKHQGLKKINITGRTRWQQESDVESTGRTMRTQSKYKGNDKGHSGNTFPAWDENIQGVQWANKIRTQGRTRENKERTRENLGQQFKTRDTKGRSIPCLSDEREERGKGVIDKKKPSCLGRVAQLHRAAFTETRSVRFLLHNMFNRAFHGLTLLWTFVITRLVDLRRVVEMWWVRAIHGLPFRAPVYRGCPCRDPPVWWPIQAEWWAIRAPTLVWLLWRLVLSGECVTRAKWKSERSNNGDLGGYSNQMQKKVNDLLDSDR